MFHPFFSRIIIHKCSYHSSKKKLYQFGISLLVSIYNQTVWIFDWLHDYICYANSHSSSTLLLSLSPACILFLDENDVEKLSYNNGYKTWMFWLCEKKYVKDKIGLEKFL